MIESLMNETEIKDLDNNIKEAKKFVEAGTALERLINNRDFKKIVMEGYFEAEAVRLVHLKADPSMQSESSQTSIISQIDAIGSFRQYLDGVFQQARLAGKAIEDDEQTRQELLEGGLD